MSTRICAYSVACRGRRVGLRGRDAERDAAVSGACEPAVLNWAGATPGAGRGKRLFWSPPLIHDLPEPLPHRRLVDNSRLLSQEG